MTLTETIKSLKQMLVYKKVANFSNYLFETV